MSMATTTDAGDSLRRSVRNPRRRGRIEGDNSPQQPRRKRSKLEKETATDTTESLRSGINALQVASFSRNEVARHKRPQKTDNSTLLAQTEHYSVRHLPSTPDVLRNSASDYRASILSSPSLALAVTRERAYIWDYTSPAPVAHPKTFDVARPARSTDPLPLAALVTTPARDTGLVVVSAVTGHVTYWQNIETAESLTLFNQQNTGVSGTLGSLSSYETVISLTCADHAGFIVTLSSGRIAQISLMDEQGKPKISAQFLRSSDAASGSGLFGTLKNALGVGPWKRDVVAVRTRPLPARREMQAIAATESGQIYTWHLAWSGQPTFRGAFDFRQFLQNELATILGQGNITLLDMVTTPASLAPDAPLQLVLLVQSGRFDSPSYAMAQVTMLSQEDARLDGIIPISAVSPTLQVTSRPRLVLPKPGHTAFVIFEEEVIVASVVGARPFQDAIRLRSDKHVTIEGGCDEDPIDTKGTSSCAVFIKGHGLARISAAQNDIPHPSIKTKIEQAIFYGTMSDNILDFSRKPHDRYDPEETEEAALLISNDILRSTSPFIPPLTSSMEVHIQNRIKAIRALILHLRSDYPTVSTPTSWRLMADAEKLAGAQAIWNTFEESMSSNPKPLPTLLPFALRAYYSKKDDTIVDPDADVMRSWFVNDVANIDKLRNMILFIILKSHEDPNSKNLMRLVSEADDILFSLYDTVFNFRQDNAEAYGLDSTLYSDGVLEQDYEELDEPWTSTFEVFNSMNQFIDIARDYAVDFFGDNTKESDVKIVNKVVEENVHLVHVLCLCYRERIGYIKTHNNDNGPGYVASMEDAFSKARAHHLRHLNKIGQCAAGITIAEKYRDMETLVKLVLNESEYLTELYDDPSVPIQERSETQGKIDRLQASVLGYFKNFGDEWSDAFFDSNLQNNRSYGLLQEAEHFKEPLTRYLRSQEARGRLSWINDVLNETDYQSASNTLRSLAQDRELKFWNKKVELSMAKLASMAAAEEKGSQEVDQRINDDLTVANMQDAIRKHLDYILYAAVDIEAEIHLASDSYAIYLKRKTPALSQLLEIAFEGMLKNQALSVEQVIDILTLMDTKESEDPEANIIGKQFLMALQALNAAKPYMEEARFETNLRLIWKRCYLQDDWEYINKTKRKSDKLVASHIRETFACQTMMQGLQLSLFTPGSGIRMMAPSETLGSGCTVLDLQSRFPTADVRDPIMRDMIIQDGQLRDLIAKTNTDHWHTVCLEEAKKKLEEDAAENAQQEQAAQQLQQSLAQAENGIEALNGGGHSNGGENEDAQMEVEDAAAAAAATKQADGDVEMA